MIIILCNSYTVPIGVTTTLPEAVVGTPRLVTIGLLVPISNPVIIFIGAVAEDEIFGNVKAPVADVFVFGSPNQGYYYYLNLEKP